MDRELVEEFFKHVADKYTAPELVDILELDVWEIIEFFEDQIIEKRKLLEE